MAPPYRSARGRPRLVRAPPAIRGDGFVVRSLEAALWAVAHTDGFDEGCLRAVNLGEDADTTAAVYEQLVGAIYGDAGDVGCGDGQREDVQRRGTRRDEGALPRGQGGAPRQGRRRRGPSGRGSREDR